MAKITLDTLATLSNEPSAIALINSNFSRIATAIENTLSRDGTFPNTMLADLDLNNKKIVHLPLPHDASEPARLTDINSALVDYQLIRDDAEAYSGVAQTAATQAQGYASAAATSATNASNSASAASTSASNASTSATSIASIATGITFTYSSTTSAADPGSGIFRMNSTTLSSVSSLYVDNNEKNGSSVTAWLDTFDDSTTTTNRGKIVIRGVTDPTKFAIFTPTSVTDSTGYRTIAVTYVAGNGTWTNGQDFGFTFSPSGDKGATGAGTGDMVAANNLSDLANAATARSNLGLGTIATQAASNVSIAGGSITGITDLAIADGGTGASSASAALTNLGGLAASLVSAFGLTLIDDADAATARTTLGLSTVAATGAFADLLSKPTTLSGYGITNAETLGTVRGLNTQTTSYTAVLTDAGKVVEINNASANTFTIPPNSSVAFPIGTYINIAQYGAGATTITPGVGVTIRNRAGLKLGGQYGIATLYKRSTDEWVAAGDLTT